MTTKPYRLFGNNIREAIRLLRQGESEMPAEESAAVPPPPTREPHSHVKPWTQAELKGVLLAAWASIDRARHNDLAGDLLAAAAFLTDDVDSGALQQGGNPK